MCFCAVGKVPVEREKLTIQEREGRIVGCCLSADERKCDLVCPRGTQPQPGAWDPSSLVMGGKVKNMGSGAGR